MNLPNRLTLLRIAMVPVYMAVLLWDFPGHYAAAIAVFAAAALTDYFDGRIARGRGLITDFGKFLDPIADKMLTTAAFVVFLPLGVTDVWAVMLILMREFAVSSVRMLAAGDGVVVAASFAGKLKTVAQYVAIIAAMAALQWGEMRTLEAFAALPEAAFALPMVAARVGIWISVALTVISGAQYCRALRRYITK